MFLFLDTSSDKLRQTNGQTDTLTTAEIALRNASRDKKAQQNMSRSVRTSGGPQYPVMPRGLGAVSTEQSMIDVARAASSQDPTIDACAPPAAALIADKPMTDGQDHSHQK